MFVGFIAKPVYKKNNCHSRFGHSINCSKPFNE